ncbi:MAG: hypothetical protein Dasosvirus3_38, partial [Dasosvirus sp.]
SHKCTYLNTIPQINRLPKIRNVVSHIKKILRTNRKRKYQVI